MKIWTAIFSGVLALILLLSAHPADAKRLGGGGSIGRQSSNVTQRQGQATPPAQGAPAPAPAVAPKKPWATLLGGLVAGAGLAWLASSLGLGGILGQILGFCLLALLVMAVVSWVFRKRQSGASNATNAVKPANHAVSAGGDVPQFSQASSSLAFSGAGASHYNPASVGNDASARPWERSSMPFEAASSASSATATASVASAGSSMMGSALAGAQSWGIPAGFDTEGFLKASQANFIRLQEAWDRSDLQSLRAMMTDEMLAQIKTQLAERETHTGGTVNTTEVAMLNAQLLGIEELSDVYMASVEFSGMIKEDALVAASPFREVWNMTKPRQGGGGWLVAGVQALQ